MTLVALAVSVLALLVAGISAYTAAASGREAVEPDEFSTLAQKVNALESKENSISQKVSSLESNGNSISPDIAKRLTSVENLALRNLMKLQYTRISGETDEVKAGVASKELDDAKGGLEDVITLINNTPWPASVQDKAKAMKDTAQSMLDSGSLDVIANDLSKLTSARSALNKAISDWAKSNSLTP